jgi:probable phosphoglycerate mutase
MALAAEQHNISAVYSSPALRAVQTALPIAEAVGAPVICTLPGPAFGQAQGRAWEDVISGLACPVEPALDKPIAEGAESWTEWVHRVGAHLDTLAAEHYGQTVVLVAHKMSVQAAEQWFHHPLRGHGICLIAADFASITEWERVGMGHSTHRRWLWARHRHNDIAHQVFELRW